MRPSGPVSIEWRDNAVNERAFVVERQQGEETRWRTLKASPANMAFGEDWMPARGGVRYRVRAANQLGASAWSNIAVATLGTGYITEISPAGQIVREVKMPDVYPTNICFGGDDMCTAYVTLSDTGRIGKLRWPEPGLKLNFN